MTACVREQLITSACATRAAGSAVPEPAAPALPAASTRGFEHFQPRLLHGRRAPGSRNPLCELSCEDSDKLGQQYSIFNVPPGDTPPNRGSRASHIVRCASEPWSEPGTSASPQSRAHVDCPVLFSLFFLQYLAFSSPPRVQQQNDLQTCDTRRSTRFNHAPCRPQRLLSFTLHFSSSSRLALSNSNCRHLDTTARQLYTPTFSHSSLPFMHLRLLYLITIAGIPEVAVTIQTRTSRQGSPHVYKPTLLLVEEAIVL